MSKKTGIVLLVVLLVVTLFTAAFVVMTLPYEEVEREYAIEILPIPSQGGEVVGGGIYKQGEMAAPEAVHASGWKFDGWVEHGMVIAEDEELSFPVKRDRLLVASFTRKEHEVSLTPSPEEGGKVLGARVYKEGKEAEVEALPEENYEFKGWRENGEIVSEEKELSFEVQEERELTAEFRKKEFEVEVVSYPGEENWGDAKGGGVYKVGEEVTVEAMPEEGYIFVDWTQDGEKVSGNKSYTFTVQEDRFLAANFRKPFFAVNTVSSPMAGGSTSGDGYYQRGNTATVTAHPEEGYTFTKWTTGSGYKISSAESYYFTVTSPTHLVAHFIREYEVSGIALPGGSGEITGRGSYKEGEEVTLTATPTEGYEFVGWEHCGSVYTEKTHTFTVEDDEVFIARFKEK